MHIANARPRSGQATHHLRHHYAAAWGLVEETCGNDYGVAEKVLLFPEGTSRINPDTYGERSLRVFPVVRLDGTLDIDGAGKRIHHIGEGHHEAVTVGLDLQPTVVLYLGPDDAVVFSEELLCGILTEALA
jgi:hypothetical protein